VLCHTWVRLDRALKVEHSAPLPPFAGHSNLVSTAFIFALVCQHRKARLATQGEARRAFDLPCKQVGARAGMPAPGQQGTSGLLRSADGLNPDQTNGD
jgi:hypothetical protein